MSEIKTSLNRVTFATDTLYDFIQVSPAKQKILLVLLGNRNMRDKPLRPSHYFSHAEIAKRTGLKETTVRVLLISLGKTHWIEQVSQRKRYTPDGRLETEYKWSVTKVIEGLARAYEDEIADDAIAGDAVEDAPEIFLFEGVYWRQGGTLEWQCRNQNTRTRNWSDTMLAPDAVLNYFSCDKLNEI